MLHEFLTQNRVELIARCKAKVARRPARSRADPDQFEHGIPLFLEQLVRTLRLEAASDPLESVAIREHPQKTGQTDIGRSAARHGNDLLLRGYTVDQVVHDYGDLCQAVTDLAVERAAQVTATEFRTLNRCLDDAIADAVAEFMSQRDHQVSAQETQTMSVRLGSLAHELRNLLDSAMLAVEAVRSGHVGVAGATGAILTRSLSRMRDVIDRSLAEVRLTASLPPRRERISVARFIAEVEVAAAMEAKTRECGFSVGPVAHDLEVDADPQMIASALANLLQNAFKFTRRHSHVSLRAYAAGERLLVEVEDECGGLPEGDAEALFQPFEQRGANRSGHGLGLSIARRCVEANEGKLRVRNRPGVGCVFTIDLPVAAHSPK